MTNAHTKKAIVIIIFLDALVRFLPSSAFCHFSVEVLADSDSFMALGSVASLMP
jgi:hypothetical protein